MAEAAVAAIDGGFGGERSVGVGSETGTAFGMVEQSVLAALRVATGAVAPADLIRDLEGAGFRNPDIRSAIWHLLDRHRIRLTCDLRLTLRPAS
ncbi:MAG: hypothetical protein ACTHMX_09270 [Thermomicrobiales bacterium]